MAYPDERTYPGREPDPEVARLRAELAWEKREHRATALAWFTMGCALIGCLCGAIGAGAFSTSHMCFAAWPIMASVAYRWWLVGLRGNHGPGTLPTPSRPPRPTHSPFTP